MPPSWGSPRTRTETAGREGDFVQAGRLKTRPIIGTESSIWLVVEGTLPDRLEAFCPVLIIWFHAHAHTLPTAHESQHVEWKESLHDEYLKWLSGIFSAYSDRLLIGKNDRGDVVSSGFSCYCFLSLPQCRDRSSSFELCGISDLRPSFALRAICCRAGASSTSASPATAYLHSIGRIDAT